MKKFFSVVSIALLSVSLWAQAPLSFSYQAVMHGANNVLVANKPVGMKISLLQGSEIGTAVYVETHKPTSNANGLVSISIGGGSVVMGSFVNIDWSKGPYFVQTETDPAGGTNYSLTSVSQLLSVPYAIHAKTAESIVGGNSGNNTGSFSHYIGEEFGGGVIFHLWKDTKGVEHGLVVATTDQSAAQAWSNITNVEIGNTAKNNWDGLINSNAIVAQAGHTSSAAKLCLDLVSGGQSDWYLPSIQELNLLWNNYFTVVIKSLSQISGATQLVSANYWSSSEVDYNNSWFFNFYYGSAQNWNGDAGGSDGKKNSYFVRAVRAF
jgi:hypothetical protein